MYQNGKLEQKSVNVIMKVVLKIDFGLEKIISTGHKIKSTKCMA